MATNIVGANLYIPFKYGFKFIDRYIVDLSKHGYKVLAITTIDLDKLAENSRLVRELQENHKDIRIFPRFHITSEFIIRNNISRRDFYKLLAKVRLHSCIVTADDIILDYISVNDVKKLAFLTLERPSITRILKVFKHKVIYEAHLSKLLDVNWLSRNTHILKLLAENNLLILSYGEYTYPIMKPNTLAYTLGGLINVNRPLINAISTIPWGIVRNACEVFP